MICVEAPEGGLEQHVINTSLQTAFLYLEAPLSAAVASEESVVKAVRDAVFY